ncbi:ABC transporter permease [Chitinophaga sp. sic0106]|uniref:ABC transporter permease n=1 Tax=Chitinophaga sp. sic0106 TaxID=2854785 RepID=UPI001C4578FE|nr:ABC transporter permease [Chitinophaga sp. sic0106]MBV7532129.1 ABC transporter permease [Chitinophaga sp. sic0106]
MIQSYLKTAIRNLLKHKIYNGLNIFGLSIGIVCAALILLWVEDEVTYDHHIRNRQQLERLYLNWNQGDGIRTYVSTPGPLGPAALANVPGVLNACRSTEGQVQALVNYQNNPMYVSGRYVDSSFLSMFQCRFLEGTISDAFSQQYGMVITKRGASKIFHQSTNVIGKTVLVDNKHTYTITAVVDDVPDNSTVKYEWLALLPNRYPNPDKMLGAWASCSLETYLLTAPDADQKKITAALSAMMIAHMPNTIQGVVMSNMDDWRLHNSFVNGQQQGGRIAYVKLLLIIAVIILSIACINFMNMATARSEQRAKEVGVRKALGARKGRLAVQFLGETLIQAMLAGIIAMILLFLLLPAFCALTEKDLTTNLLSPLHITVLMALILCCGLLAGCYPALYLASFHPVSILKGLRIKSLRTDFIRKGLVVTQFTISISLIIATLVIYQQIKHVKSRDMGFNTQHMLSVNMAEGKLANFDPIRQDLYQTGVVANTSVADYNPLYGGNNTNDISWDGKEADKSIITSLRFVDKNYLPTMGMQLVEGENFRAVKDDSVNVIINESLAKLISKGSVLGQPLYMIDDTAVIFKFRIAGVVKNYVYGDMYGSPDPLVFFNIPSSANTIFIKLEAGADPAKAIAKIGAVITRHDPAYPFRYQFLDDQFNDMFRTEMLTQHLSRIFAGIAILISCLGLFGLSAYTAERRTREIGVRKVLGASVSSIVQLLTTDFLRLLGIAILIAFPLSWWLMHSWLQQYAYRISIGPMIFVIAGMIALLTTLLTVSFQSIRASLVNPVNSLKSE